VSAVHIDIIETLPSLARLEDNWNAVYDADDEAQIFLAGPRRRTRSFPPLPDASGR
jgi:hypothetical protein